MSMTSTFDFRWLSPLGISVALFLFYGVMNIVIGILIPIANRLSDSELPGGILFMSARSDEALFGRSASDLVKHDTALATLRQLNYAWMAGLFVSFGILQLGLTWFGLRSGNRWALWTLTVGDLAMLPYWALIFQPYLRAGTPLGLQDIPPLFLYLAIIVVAAIVGWFGLR